MLVKYVISERNDPFKNLALEEYLYGFVGKGKAIVYLWQNKNTIVVGRHQNINAECKRQDFGRAGGLIARRKSGGGAVYHDLGNLNYSIITISEEKELLQYTEIIRKALVSIGINTDFNGRNDFLFEGKKISGNAIYDNGNVCCQHGTILVNSDIELIDRYLTPEISKMKRNNIKSVYSRMRNLSEIDPDITVEDVMNAILDITNAEKLDFNIDMAKLNDLENFYRSDIWLE